MNINDNAKQSQSQSSMIRAALLQGDTITPLDALRRFGCFRLGARIYDLEKQGLPIKKERITLENGKKVMSYRLQGNGVGC